jgi:putative acetyltransferase
VSQAPVALRDFDEADLPALLDLWVAAWSETGFSIDFGGRRSWLEHRLRVSSRRTRRDAGRFRRRRPACGLVTLDPANGYLDQLCVAPSGRGSGLAGALLDAAKRLAPGAVELDVNDDNARARSFNERKGFQAIPLSLSVRSGLPTLRMRWTADA